MSIVGMRIGEILRFLIGDRRAILALAANRWSLVVGFLFVLSAGIAREYDGQDLLAEPWHLLIPFVASLLASFFLFALASQKCVSRESQCGSFLSAYLSFLGLFWLTAPLALLYAVPYEQFLSPLDATRANLATLGVVAAWRVVLIVRVLVVLMNFRIWTATLLVLAFADAMILAGLAPQHIGMLLLSMGGVRDEFASDRLLADVSSGIAGMGCLSFPFLCFGAYKVLREQQSRWQAEMPSWSSEGRPTHALWSFLIAIFVLWMVVLSFSQPPQQLRTRIEAAMNEERYADALAELSQHEPEDLPAGWQLPPRRRTNTIVARAQLLGIYRVIKQQPTPKWLRDAYITNLRRWLTTGLLDDETLEELAPVLKQIPDRESMLLEMEKARIWYRAEKLRSLLERQDDSAE